MAHDIIGDLHGHGERLEALLTKLGYRLRAGAWRHPSRTAIFVGDFIDRGPGQLRTLELVRSMLDGGSARAVMGNHEFNAIAWWTPDPLSDGQHLRPRHGPKGDQNRRQHAAFLSEVTLDGAEHRRWVEWFYELPLWIEEPGFRVVHACWSPEHVQRLRPRLRDGARLDEATVEAASRKGSKAHDAVEVILKGAEVRLPDGHTFMDKDGHLRDSVRVRWWEPEATTYRQAYIGPPAEMPDLELDRRFAIPEPDRPTFIGHYWFDPAQRLGPVARRVACVDYSVANDGPLVAYRFDGEPELSEDKFVAV